MHEHTRLLSGCPGVAGVKSGMRNDDIVVSNKVRLGLMLDNALGRLYRALLGHANQALAWQAQTVYFMVASLAVDVKALARPTG